MMDFFKKIFRRISKIEAFLRPNMFLFFSNSTYNLEKIEKKFFRRAPNLFPELRICFPNSEFVFQTPNLFPELRICFPNSEFVSQDNNVSIFDIRRKKKLKKIHFTIPLSWKKIYSRCFATQKILAVPLKADTESTKEQKEPNYDILTKNRLLRRLLPIIQCEVQ